MLSYECERQKRIAIRISLCACGKAPPQIVAHVSDIHSRSPSPSYIGIRLCGTSTDHGGLFGPEAELVAGERLLLNGFRSSTTSSRFVTFASSLVAKNLSTRTKCG